MSHEHGLVEEAESLVVFGHGQFSTRQGRLKLREVVFYYALVNVLYLFLKLDVRIVSICWLLVRPGK